MPPDECVNPSSCRGRWVSYLYPMAFDRLRSFLTHIIELDPNALVNKAMENPNIRAQILDLNTLSQLYDKGVDSKGRSLGGYAPFTIEYKQKIAASLGHDTRSDHVTLKDTGEFYSSFKFIPYPDGFQIEADVEKEGGVNLETLYGPILGLTDESKTEILPAISELVREQIREAIRA